jgi:hypothetical protein
VARLAYSYLGALLAAVAAGLVGLVGYAVAGATPACRGDLVGWCQPVVTAAVVLVGLCAALFLAGHLVGLGWLWASWAVALTLVLVQVVVETGDFAWAAAWLGVPALAVLPSFERPDRAIGRVAQVVRLVALAAALGQFVVWFVVWMATG